MLLSLIQLLALIGLVMLLLSWGVSTDMLAIIGGLVGTFAWGLVTYGLFAVETMDTTGTHSEPAFALFALAAAVVTLLPALVNPFEIVGGARESNDPIERL